MKFLFALVCLVAFAAGSTIPGRVLPKLKPLGRLPPVEGRITGGTLVPAISSRPFQVGLFLDNQYFCGGSLISNQWIFTAAHCAAGFSSIVVVLGTLDVYNGTISQTIAVNSTTNVYVHEGYVASTITNDIAVIKLNTPVTLTSNVQPISLPKATNPVNLYVGVTAKSSGWGKTSDNATSITQYLQWTDLTVIKNSVCSSVFGTRPASQLCTQTAKPRSTCNGDSGGPLTYNNTIIGVVSYVASAGCELGYPDGFSRVTSFLTWINQKTGIPIPV